MAHHDYREADRKYRDFQPRRQDRQSPTGMRNDTKEGYYGSPYDVGNYASHYDERDYNVGDQPVGLEPDRQALKQKDHSGKGPRGYQRSDKRILEDVNDHLYLDPYIDASDIEVQVDNSDVVLTGTAEDRNAKRRAEDIANAIPGVKNVENRIRVTKTHTAGPVRSNVREELM